MRKDLLLQVSNPKVAKTIDESDDRIRDWDTNCRLMVGNGGSMPDDATRRAAFVEMFPREVSTYITMRLEELEFDTYSKITA